MRLIDVDALLENQPKGCYRTSDWINNAPTIDAIPVEWLQRRRDIYLKAYHAGHESEIHTAAILNDTLKAWHKEQEAANETGRP